LHVIKKLVVLRIEQAPRYEEIELAAIESAFNCG
jgi:hypothetical protein